MDMLLVSSQHFIPPSSQRNKGSDLDYVLLYITYPILQLYEGFISDVGTQAHPCCADRQLKNGSSSMVLPGIESGTSLWICPSHWTVNLSLVEQHFGSSSSQSQLIQDPDILIPGIHLQAVVEKSQEGNHNLRLRQAAVLGMFDGQPMVFGLIESKGTAGLIPKLCFIASF